MKRIYPARVYQAGTPWTDKDFQDDFTVPYILLEMSDGSFMIAKLITPETYTPKVSWKQDKSDRLRLNLYGKRTRVSTKQLHDMCEYYVENPGVKDITLSNYYDK